jgi:hypothetical protein
MEDKVFEDLPKVEHFTDNETYSYWQIKWDGGCFITGDGGMEEFNKAMNEYIINYIKENKED